jgi:phosphoribosyl-ATP pyrophosphohydrolase
MAESDDVITRLGAVIAARRNDDPAESYVAGLLQGEEDRLLKKLGEESTEVILAAKSGKPEAICAESADLMFHLMVILARHKIDLGDVCRVLESRMGVSGLEEKTFRTQGKSS